MKYFIVERLVPIWGAVVAVFFSLSFLLLFVWPFSPVPSFICIAIAGILFSLGVIAGAVAFIALTIRDILEEKKA